MKFILTKIGIPLNFYSYSLRIRMKAYLNINWPKKQIVQEDLYKVRERKGGTYVSIKELF